MEDRYHREKLVMEVFYIMVLFRKILNKISRVTVYLYRDHFQTLCFQVGRALYSSVGLYSVFTVVYRKVSYISHHTSV